MTRDLLSHLYDIVSSRRTADPETSYVAKLLGRGRAKIAQKIGEEGVETALAAVSQDKAAIISESADLLFHLAILWADAAISPQEIAAELARREGQSGLAEKAQRPKE